MGRVRRLNVAILVIILAVAGTATAEVVQVGNLRITVLGQVLPYKLPRSKPAPIAVFISGHVDTVDGAVPPQLQKMVIRVNRHGLLRSRGLPPCTLEQLQPGSSDRALANCRDALVGSGRFWASVVFPDQRPYPTRGRLLVFNGSQGGGAVLFAHIYTTEPFNTSFVVTFGVRKIRQGPFGTELVASFPKALGEWGFVNRIKLTLRRNYIDHGQQRGFFNAGCPAPAGTSVASYQLARTSFFFSQQKPITVGVVKSCAVKE
ncbi:MAG TPA: hypothetical protein VFX35_06325 [Solirubrobacterales bacterium]|nr:hypothetical protein [Solirubrobacterales bacterium]